MCFGMFSFTPRPATPTNGPAAQEAAQKTVTAPGLPGANPPARVGCGRRTALNAKFPRLVAACRCGNRTGGVPAVIFCIAGLNLHS